MRLTILGAGGVGAAAAVLATARGHQVTLWSPRGHSTAGIGASLRAEGMLNGGFPVRVAADLGRAVADAEAILLALPGHAQPATMRRLAAVLQGTPSLLVTPASALSPLLLDRLLVARGLRIAIGALAVPPVVATRLAGDGVRILAIRRRLWIGAVPATMAGAFRPLLRALFGAEADPLPDALAAALVDIAPLLQAAQSLAPALAPAAGGQGEAAPLSRLAHALVAERDALARALGLTLPDATTLYAESGGLPPATPERALEDAPHGLTFLLALGRAAAVPMPVAQSVLTLLEVLGGRRFAENPVLAMLNPDQLAVQIAQGAAGMG